MIVESPPTQKLPTDMLARTTVVYYSRCITPRCGVVPVVRLLRLSRMASIFTAPHPGLNWHLGVDDIKAETQRLVAASDATLDAIAAYSGPAASWEGVMAPLAALERDAEPSVISITFVKDVSSDKDVRAAATAARAELRAYEVRAGMRRDVFLKVKAFAESADLAALDDEAQRFVERTLRDYRRRGLDLPDAARARVEALRTRMSDVSVAYGQALAEDATRLSFRREDLRGMPEDWLAGLGERRRGGSARGGRVPLCPFSFPPILSCSPLCDRARPARGHARLPARRPHPQAVQRAGDAGRCEQRPSGSFRLSPHSDHPSPPL